MERSTKDVTEMLKQHIDALPNTAESWEAISRIMLIVYGKMVGLSAHLAPDADMKRVIQAHVSIANALKELAELIKEGRE
jgi:hypothetical protein